MVHRVVNLHWRDVVLKPNGAHAVRSEHSLHRPVLEATLSQVLAVLIETTLGVFILSLGYIENVFYIELASSEWLRVDSDSIELVIHLLAVASLNIL